MTEPAPLSVLALLPARSLQSTLYAAAVCGSPTTTADERYTYGPALAPDSHVAARPRTVTVGRSTGSLALKVRSMVLPVVARPVALAPLLETVEVNDNVGATVSARQQHDRGV